MNRNAALCGNGLKNQTMRQMFGSYGENIGPCFIAHQPERKQRERERERERNRETQTDRQDTQIVIGNKCSISYIYNYKNCLQLNVKKSTPFKAQHLDQNSINIKKKEKICMYKYREKLTFVFVSKCLIKYSKTRHDVSGCGSMFSRDYMQLFLRDPKADRK